MNEDDIQPIPFEYRWPDRNVVPIRHAHTIRLIKQINDLNQTIREMCSITKEMMEKRP